MAATLDGRVGGTADANLEFAVMDKRGLHVLAFPVRKSGTDWADAVSKKRIDLAPTHWRPWRRDDKV